MVPAGEQQYDDTVKQLLDQARGAIRASNATQALQHVVEALKLIRGDNAVIPTLRAAAEHYHTERAAPTQEISALLAQVSLQTQQQPSRGSLQQYQQAGTSQQQQQQHNSQQFAGMPDCSQVQRHQQLDPQLTFLQEQQQLQQLQQLQQHLQAQLQQHQQQQPMMPGQACCEDGFAILNETGRGDMTSFALADGSSWQCPHCAGVVLLHRKQAHLDSWCPQLHRNNSGGNGDDMAQ